jgi:DNA repair exonuclease SbcCD ATPase subunit
MRELAEKALDAAKANLTSQREHSSIIKESVDLTRLVAMKTQSAFERQVSAITNMALDSVFQGKYVFNIKFIAKRNNSEAYVSLTDKEGNELNPLDSNGGTIVDIIAFAMRLTMWRLANPRRRNTIIMDEPMKFVSRDLVPLAGDMIKTLSDKLGIQFIIVTHIPEFVERADKVIDIQ